MSTVQDVKGVSQTAIDAGGLANMLAAGLVDGRVKCCIDTYTADTSLASGSTIEFCGELPAGAKIIGGFLAATIAQASLTFTFGTQYNADEFVVTGEDGLQTALAPVVFSGRGYVVGTDTLDNQLVLTTEASDTTTGVITCVVFYTTD